MKFNLKDWRKIGDHQDHTLLRNKEGHELKIAKRPLSKKAREALAMIPHHEDAHMADGGEVEDKKKDSKTNMEKGMKSIRDAFNKKSYAEGGEVSYGGTFKPKKEKEEDTNTKKFLKGLNKAFKYDGGEIEDSAHMAEGGEVETPQPVSININAAPPSEPISTQAIQEASGQPLSQSGQEMSQLEPQMGQAPGIQPPSLQQEGQKLEDQKQQVQDAQPQSQLSKLVNMEPKTPEQALVKGSAESVIGGDTQLGGLLGQSEAEQAQVNAEAKTLTTKVAAQQKVYDKYQSELDAINHDNEALQHDIDKQHINPEKYMGNLDTPNRIMAGIAIGLGSIGSAITGQPNAALQIIQKNIDRDIASQEADLGKKQSLLQANLHRYGNVRDAMASTNVQMNSLIENSLKRAALQTQSPIIKAKYLQLAGQLEQQMAPVKQQLAIRQTLLREMGPEGAGERSELSNIDPALLIESQVPKEQQKDAFKELKEAQDIAATKRNVMSAFDKISNINTVGNRATSPIKSYREINALKQPLVAELSKATAGRFTEQDASMLDSLFPAAGDDDDTIGLKKQAIDRLISEKMHFPILKGNMIDPSRFESTSGSAEASMSSRDKFILDWARKNPNTPQAKIIFKKFGTE